MYESVHDIAFVFVSFCGFRESVSVVWCVRNFRTHYPVMGWMELFCACNKYNEIAKLFVSQLHRILYQNERNLVAPQYTRQQCFQKHVINIILHNYCKKDFLTGKQVFLPYNLTQSYSCLAMAITNKNKNKKIKIIILIKRNCYLDKFMMRPLYVKIRSILI